MNFNKKLFLILLLGLALRLALLTYFWNKPPKIVDEIHYHTIAEHILKYNEYSLIEGRPTSIRPPLYPAFLSAIYWITGGVHYNAVRLVQIILSLGIIYMVYLLAKDIFDKKTGLISAFIFAVYPSFLCFTHFLLTEILFTLLLLLFIYFFLSLSSPSSEKVTPSSPSVPSSPSLKSLTPSTPSAPSASSSKSALLAGLFLGLGALTRSILYPFLPVAIIFLFIFNKEKLIKNMKYALLLILGYAVIITPWAVRNTILQKTLVIVDVLGGLNEYMGNYEHTPLNRAWAAIDVKGDKAWYHGHEKTLAGMTEGQKQKWAFREAISFILQNKMLTIKRNLIKAANMWGLERVVIGGILDGKFSEFNKWYILIPLTFLIFAGYSIVALSSVFGIVFNFKKYQIIFLILIIAYFTGVHSLIFGHSRYHLPLIPLLIMFSAWTFFNIREIWEKRNTPEFKIAAIISSVLIAIWIREIVFIEGARYISNIIPG